MSVRAKTNDATTEIVIGVFHIPSDLVVDSWASDGESR